MGDCIIRPAQGAKGAVCLAASVKLYSGKVVGPIVHNVDVSAVISGGAQPAVHTSDFRKGGREVCRSASESTRRGRLKAAGCVLSVS